MSRREVGYDKYYCLLWKNDMHILHCIIAWLLYNCWYYAYSMLEEYLLVWPMTVISPIIIFSSIVSRSAYGCPTNDLANAWLWLPHINFTIHHSSPTIDFARNLNGHPHFLLPVTVHTKSFFLTLYFPLLSQPIKTNKVLPLFPVSMSDLTIIDTKPILDTTDWTQCKT